MASPPPISRAPFPAPPPFWREFTATNVTKLEAIKRDRNTALSDKKHAWKPPNLRALELPIELQHLVPPPPPTEATYQVFGQPQPVTTSLPSLSSQGVTQLFPDTPPSTPTSSPITYLLLLTKSLLLNFNEFTSILSSNPSEAADKLEDIKTLFVNAHHLINMYRPHQARETLVLMMEEQIKEAKNDIEACERTTGAIKGLLSELETEGKQTTNDKPTLTRENATRDSRDEKEVKELWEMIHGNIE